jgi:phosphoglycerate dehydrogenase-like enzyme
LSSETKPNVLIVSNQRVRDQYLDPKDLARLEAFANWEWLHAEGREAIYSVEADPAALNALLERVGDVDGLVVCHGSPRIDAAVMDRAPRLRVIGELEGDRFASRIDVEAAWEHGIRTLDTTNGSSYPVAEWALALAIISLRNAGEQFRHMIAPEAYRRPYTDFGYVQGELYGKKVGLIGAGHIGRRLISFLKPFHCEIMVHDPYLPKEVPDILDVLQTSLDHVMADNDVVICLAPLTPRTRGMIGKRELDLLRPGSVFVNVSRGAIVDSDALIERLRRGDVVAGLDVFDPEPIPADSPIKSLPNVFLTPHIAGVTARSRTLFFELMVDELDRFFHGHETRYDLLPRTLANRRGEEVGTGRT